MKPAIRVWTMLCLLTAPAAGTAQTLPFEDVVGNLNNPDPELRIAAVQLLRDAQYPEAVVPMAALVNDADPVVQLEAINAELSFFLIEEIPARERVALLFDGPSRAERAYQLGFKATWPKRPPAELIAALVAAIDDDDPRVRLEALYTLGVIGAGVIDDAAAKRLTLALEHHDPMVRAVAARVTGRLQVASAGEGLLKAIHDADGDVRRAAMRALGDIRDENAVKPLTEQVTYHGKGPGAVAALDALARIGHPSSIPEFEARLRDPDPLIRRAAAEGLGRAGGRAAAETLRDGAIMDESKTVRVAMAFALNALGEAGVVRMIDEINSVEVMRQVQGYLFELGPSVVPQLLPRLHESFVPTRLGVIETLGVLGDTSVEPALARFLDDEDLDLARAATLATAKIKMRAR